MQIKTNMDNMDTIHETNGLDFSELHCASLLRTIFASLARAHTQHEKMSLKLSSACDQQVTCFHLSQNAENGKKSPKG